LALDPGNIDAVVGTAQVDVIVGSSFMTGDGPARFAAAEAASTKVLSLTPNHTLAHLVLGYIQMFTNRAAQGIRECEEALALDRNLADAHGALGFAKFYMGRAAETEGHIFEAFRLSPRDKDAHFWMYILGAAKIHLGADAEAVGWLRRSIEKNRNLPPAHFALAAASGLLGALDEARGAVRGGLALNPGFTIRRLRAVKPSDNPAFLAGLERACMGMRLAGVPEG
jgi:tetratricopeptide (TPR) repeat protein